MKALVLGVGHQSPTLLLKEVQHPQRPGDTGVPSHSKQPSKCENPIYGHLKICFYVSGLEKSEPRTTFRLVLQRTAVAALP